MGGGVGEWTGRCFQVSGFSVAPYLMNFPLLESGHCHVFNQRLSYLCCGGRCEAQTVRWRGEWGETLMFSHTGQKVGPRVA